jgi:hypothetical protein
MAVLYACLGIFQLQWVVPKSPVDPGYTCIGLGKHQSRPLIEFVKFGFIVPVA